MAEALADAARARVLIGRPCAAAGSLRLQLSAGPSISLTSRRPPPF